MKNLTDLLTEYRELKAKADFYTKESRRLGEEIKAEMKERAENVVEHDGFKYECKTRIQSKVTEDLLIDYLREREFDEALSITTVVNEDVLVEYLKEGKVTQEEISQFIETKEINSIYIRQIKEKKEEESLWD